MSARKTERLLNLVIALLATRRPLTAEDIRRAVPGYADDDVAFKRTFERDKEELRDLGVPLEVAETWDDEAGYRIARRDYELPDIDLEPDEAAAVGLAARLWGQASFGDAAAWARRKLAAAGLPVDVELPALLEPRLDAAEPSFQTFSAALLEGRAVRFRYRTSAGPESERRLEPWGLVHRRGVWYVVGHDVDRGETRVFRLSRVVGAVTQEGPPRAVTVPELDVAALVADRIGEAGAAGGVARVRVRPGRAGDLRREALSSAAGADGWDILEVALGSIERFVPRLAGYGADLVVEAPDELRNAMSSWFRQVLAGAR